MGEALLMVALPALIAGLPVSRAMVKVGPPLSCREPRLSCSVATVVAQEKFGKVTRLFAAEVGLSGFPEGIRLTVPTVLPEPVE